MSDNAMAILRVVLVIVGTIVALILIAAQKRRKQKRDALTRFQTRALPRGTFSTGIGDRSGLSSPPLAASQPPRAPRPVIPIPQPAPATPGAKPPPVPDRTLDLDAGAFKPITDEQAREATAGVTSWGSALWTFGRQSIIPPIEDPRTSLIDRAMVGHGLITPEELVDIHAIGRKMDELRPQWESAGQIAERAVRQDREARAQLKAQKKAEAEERKRRHAEAVAQRKATDIIYLGRGVSKGLADRATDVEKLRKYSPNLPVLSTPADVAAALKLSIPRLRFLAFHADATPVSHYVRFAVPKRSGGTRMLAAPMPELAAAQEWILRNVLDHLKPHSAAHGFVAGASTVSNARPHVHKPIVLNTDLRDFFPTITFPRVLGVFRELGYSRAVSTILALLCTDAPRKKVTYAGRPFFVATGERALPQGACTSPALSNLVARRLDSRLDGIARKLAWTYTRYADDLSFSAENSDSTGRIGYLLARIRHITQDEGFAVNESKTRVLRQSTRQLVTGVVVNARPSIPRDEVRRLRAILHRAKFEGLASQNREKLPHFEAWLSGMIAYIHMVNPQQAEPLRRALAEVRS